MHLKQREIDTLWQRALDATGRGSSPCSKDLVTAYARLVRDYLVAQQKKAQP